MRHGCFAFVPALLVFLFAGNAFSHEPTDVPALDGAETPSGEATNAETPSGEATNAETPSGEATNAEPAAAPASDGAETPSGEAPAAEAAPAPDAPAYVADRPGFTYGANTVPQFGLAVEGGVEAAFGDDGASVALPVMMVRFGIVDWLEARLLVPNVAIVIPEEGETDAGIADVGVSLKGAWEIVEGFALCIVPTVTFPTGKSLFSGNAWDLNLAVNAELSITDALGIAAGVFGGVALPEEGEGSLLYSAFAFAVGYGITDSVSAYVESYVLKAEEGDWLPAVGAGVMYQVLPWMQLDGYFAMGVVDGADDPYAGLGIGVLW